MKTTLRLLTIQALAFFVAMNLFAADPSAPESREQARAEQRMKDEKRQDEDAARNAGQKVKVARFDSVWRGPSARDIDVFQLGEKPKHSFKVIAFMTYECAAHEEAQSAAGFIAKSKDLGADAVVFVAFDAPFSETRVFNLIAPNDRRVFRANAVVYQR
jgi:hypothetical protein